MRRVPLIRDPRAYRCQHLLVYVPLTHVPRMISSDDISRLYLANVVRTRVGIRSLGRYALLWEMKALGA